MKFHIFHDWGKWEDCELQQSVGSSPWEIVSGQRRYCLECGQKEVRVL